MICKTYQNPNMYVTVIQDEERKWQKKTFEEITASSYKFDESYKFSSRSPETQNMISTRKPHPCNHSQVADKQSSVNHGENNTLM